MKKHGSGSLTSYDNKYIYDGEWKENRKNGYGQLINNKNQYSGGFKKLNFINQVISIMEMVSLSIVRVTYMKVNL